MMMGITIKHKDSTRTKCRQDYLQPQTLYAGSLEGADRRLGPSCPGPAAFLLFCLAPLLMALYGCGDDSFLRESVTQKLAVPTEAETMTDPVADSQRIFHLLEQDEPEAIYRLCTEEAQIHYGQSEIIDRHRNIHKDIGLQRVEIGEVKMLRQDKGVIDEDKRIYSAEVIYHTAYGPIARSNTYTFCWDPSRKFWALDWEPSVILPGLHDAGSVRLDRLAPHRGKILDAKGKILAEDGVLTLVGLDPARHGELLADPASLTALAKCFDLNEEDLRKTLQDLGAQIPDDQAKDGPAQPNPVAAPDHAETPDGQATTPSNQAKASDGKAMTPASQTKANAGLGKALPQVFYPLGEKEDKILILAVAEDLTLPQKTFAADHGLIVKKISTRLYPYGKALAPLVGYVSQVTQEDLAEAPAGTLAMGEVLGRTGMEKTYEKDLRGEPGLVLKITGAYEQTLLETPPKDGRDLTLTVDAALQDRLYHELEPYAASLVLREVQGGAIKALVSTPSFDPYSFSVGIGQAAYDALLHDPKRPLVAKFLENTVPGSSQKVLTAMAALRAKLWAQDDTMDINENTWQADSTWGDYYVRRFDKDVNGSFDLKKALVHSDNIFFARLSLKMGVDPFLEGMKKLGYGASPITDFPATPSMVMPNGFELYPILLGDSGYGQGAITMSPIHLANVYAALADPEGRLLQAHLLKETEPAPMAPQDYQALGKEDQEYLQEALASVVTESYPFVNRGPVLMAGKSGTAELGLEGEVMQTNSSFTGFMVPKALAALSREEAKLTDNYVMTLSIYRSDQEKKQISSHLFGDLYPLCLKFLSKSSSVDESKETEQTEESKETDESKETEETRP